MVSAADVSKINSKISGELDQHKPPIQRPLSLASKEIVAYVNAQALKGRCTPVHDVSWYNPASTPEHHIPGFPNNLGCAVDFMTTDPKTQDILNDYVWKNRKRLGVCWIISRRRIRSTSPGHSGNWTPYSGPSPHTDHTHVNFGHLVGNNGYSRFPVQPYSPPPGAIKYDVIMYAGDHGAIGYDSHGKIKHKRAPGFKIIGAWDSHTFNDGKYLRTKWGTFYPQDQLKASK